MDVTNTKTGTTSPSERTFNPAAVLNPTSVPCKVCDAPAGGKCQNGKQYVDWFHIIRVQDATAAVPAGTEQQNAIADTANNPADANDANTDAATLPDDGKAESRKDIERGPLGSVGPERHHPKAIASPIKSEGKAQKV
jgi:hypothetical protein